MKLRGFSALASVFALAALGFTPACDDSSADDTTSSGSGSEGDDGSGLACEDEWIEDKMVDPAMDIQDVWGTPCESDADCAQLGENGECFTDVLGVYSLPGGACSIRCTLPDAGTTVVEDAEECDPNGGIACMGAKDIFSACLPPCTSDSQCSREGYGCIRMPTISAEGDASFCLMNPNACCLDPSMCT